MDCESCRSQLIASLAGTLAPEDRSPLDTHLEYCAPCHKESERIAMLLAAIDRGVAASVAGEPSPRMLFELRRRIDAHGAPQAWSLPIPALSAALVLAIFVVLLLNWRIFVPNRVARHVPAQTTPQIEPAAPRAGSPAIIAAVHPKATKPAPVLPKRAGISLTVPKLAAPGPARLAAALPETPDFNAVLTSADEWHGLLQLAAAMQGGQVDATEWVQAEKTAQPPIAVAILKVQPIPIPDLNQDSVPGPPSQNTLNR